MARVPSRLFDTGRGEGRFRTPTNVDLLSGSHSDQHVSLGEFLSLSRSSTLFGLLWLVSNLNYYCFLLIPYLQDEDDQDPIEDFPSSPPASPPSPPPPAPSNTAVTLASLLGVNTVNTSGVPPLAPTIGGPPVPIVFPSVAAGTIHPALLNHPFPHPSPTQPTPPRPPPPPAQPNPPPPPLPPQVFLPPPPAPPPHDPILPSIPLRGLHPQRRYLLGTENQPARTGEPKGKTHKTRSPKGDNFDRRPGSRRDGAGGSEEGGNKGAS